MQSVRFNCKTFLHLIVQPEENHPGPLNDLIANDRNFSRSATIFAALIMAESDTSRRSSASSSCLRFGSLRISPRKNLRLDGGIFIGVTPAADDWHPWLGMTWRF